MSNTKEKLNIICFSNQLWDFPNWTNKRHVMSRMAKLGHNVLFVDPPINTGFVFYRQIQRGLWPVKRIFSQLKKDPTGALVYTPLNLIPQTDITSKLHAKRIRNLARKRFSNDQKTVVWVYHMEIPGLENYLEILNYDLLVYDCVDHYEAFPQYDTKEKKSVVRAREKYLAEKADLIFASAPGLVDKLRSYNRNVHFTPNVGDYEKFKNSSKLADQLPEDLASIKRPRIGFTGALDEYKFDAELMRKAALDHPDYSFILIGQIALKDKGAGLKTLGLDGLPNVHFLGFKPYDTLETYFAGFDAYIIPYQLNDYTVGGCFPVKFHDSLAAGLPTVVTDLPAYMPFEEVSYISKNYQEFSANVKRAIEDDNDSRKFARQNVARENNWDGKVEKMINLISDNIYENARTKDMNGPLREKEA